jgi:uncharacterized membrane protein YjjP (DUF1212 family)
MNDSRLQTNLLLQAGRLLLEYNEATEAIQRALVSTARSLTAEACHVVVTYDGVAVSLGNEVPALVSVPELRFNTAVQARVHGILADVRRGNLEAESALDRLGRVATETPRHPRWLAAPILGLAASSLAGLLGADLGAAAVAGFSTGVGLIARQELGRRHFSLLMLPFTATLIGAVLGGLTLRLGWTQSPGLALMVPALMVVPGPHLINGLLDLIDNHLSMSLARLGLAAGILLASALGIVTGIELTLGEPAFADQAARGLNLSLITDMLLAGVVTCGFAVFYNTAWPQVAMAIVGGMAGHGLRFLALEGGLRLEQATLLGGLAVGVVSALIARFHRVPVAVIGFAGAVTMIPGLHLYRALGGVVQLARTGPAADAELISRTLGYALQGGLVVAALALGLILGARIVQMLARREDAS